MWYLTNFSVPKTIANKDRRVLGNRGRSQVREADCKQDIFAPWHVNTRLRFVAPRRPHPRYYDGIVNSPYGFYAEDVTSSRAEDWNGQRTLADGTVYSTTRPEGARSSYLAHYKHTFGFRMRINLELRQTVGPILSYNVYTQLVYIESPSLRLLWICVNKYRLEKSICPRAVLKCRSTLYFFYHMI